MSSKTVIITGANGGIGKEIALYFASKGYCVIMACRNLEKAAKAAQEIKASTLNNNIIIMELDISSFDSIKSFASEINSRYNKIDILINNSGIMCKNYETSPHGYEMEIAVNLIGTVMLCKLLIDKMRGTTPSTIVNTVSLTNSFAKIGDFIFENHPKKHRRLRNYANSKLALYIFTSKLAQQLRHTNISVNAADPGIVSTNMISMKKWYDPLTDLFFRPFIHTPKTGAMAAINAATSQSTPPQTNHIFYKKTNKKIPHRISSHPYAPSLEKKLETALTPHLPTK